MATSFRMFHRYSISKAVRLSWSACKECVSSNFRRQVHGQLLYIPLKTRPELETPELNSAIAFRRQASQLWVYLFSYLNTSLHRTLQQPARALVALSAAEKFMKIRTFQTANSSMKKYFVDCFNEFELWPKQNRAKRWEGQKHPVVLWALRPELGW